MGVQQRGEVDFVQSEESAVLGGVSLQHPPPSEGTETQDNTKTLAAIHCSYSHMRASAPGLLLQQILREFPRGKEREKKKQQLKSLLRQKHSTEHHILCGNETSFHPASGHVAACDREHSILLTSPVLKAPDLTCQGSEAFPQPHQVLWVTTQLC